MHQLKFIAVLLAAAISHTALALPINVEVDEHRLGFALAPSASELSLDSRSVATLSSNVDPPILAATINKRDVENDGSEEAKKDSGALTSATRERNRKWEAWEQAMKERRSKSRKITLEMANMKVESAKQDLMAAQRHEYALRFPDGV